MTKYALLLYSAEDSVDEAGMAEEMPKWFAFTEELMSAGSHLGGEALVPTAVATTVRVRDGKTITADGPFAETKETLGGFYLLEAENLDEAIKWAEKIPLVDRGTVEVRPIMELPDAP